MDLSTDRNRNTVQELRDVASFCAQRGWGGAEEIILQGATELDFYKRQEKTIARIDHALSERDIKELYNATPNQTWPRRTPPWLYMVVNPEFRNIGGYWLSWANLLEIIACHSPFYEMRDYWRTWGLFSMKPTEEQVKAIKWLRRRPGK